jgi:hypothetical protein
MSMNCAHAGFGGPHADFLSIEDSLAERREFELPVLISEQPGDNMMSGFRRPRSVGIA